MIGKEKTKQIIGEVTEAVNKWKTFAFRLGISKREMDILAKVYKHSLK